jgi:hypothetical protein
MKRIIKLNESQLTHLIKRVIKETEEESQTMDPVTPDETSELDNEIQRVEYQLQDSDLGSISDAIGDVDVNTDIDQEFQEKIQQKNLNQVYQKNKEFIDSEISNIKEIANKHDLCKRAGRKQAMRELRNKIGEIFRKIKENKKGGVNEQVLSGILLGVGWLIVMFILMFGKRIIKGDGCRRWSRWKQTRMSGYGGRGW